MSLPPYINFIEPTQIPTNLFWLLMGIPVNYLLKQLWQRHPINRQTILKTFLGMKLGWRILSFLGVTEVQSIMNKLHIQKFDAWFDNASINHLIEGFLIFKKLEPKAAMGMLLIIKKYTEQYRINKITGLDKSPDLTKFDDDVDTLVSLGKKTQ